LKDYVNSVRSLENWQFDLKYVMILVAVFKAHEFMLQLKIPPASHFEFSTQVGNKFPELVV